MWHSDLFVPTVRDGKVCARGKVDNKSPFNGAFKSFGILCQKMEVPVNVILVFEVMRNAA